MSDLSIRARAHNIERAEWERRFKARFNEVLQPKEGEYPGVVEAELESWPEHPAPHDGDWRDELPEDAMDENFSYWSD